MLLNYLLALLSGILLVIVHPGVSAEMLAPLAVTPLVYALAREWSPKHRFLLGYLTGFTFWAGMNYWIQFVISVHGGLGPIGGSAVFVLFCLLKAIHLGVFGLLAGVLVQHRHALVAIPALWVAVERIPSWFFYTWLTLGNAGINMGVPMRLAPFTGVYGLSFLFAMFGTAVAWIALRRPRRNLLYILVAIPLFALPELPELQKGRESAVSVQPSIEDREDWTREQASDLQRRLEYLTLASALAAKLPPASLILWPEVPAPVYYFEDTPLRDHVSNMARIARASVLMGTVAHNDRGAPLNAALMISPQGEPIGRYDKMFPVPFGEYIPWPFGAVAKKITSEIGDFEPGNKVVTFPLGANRIGAFICYESAFPHLVRQFAVQGATVYANISNDGYFGRSAAREQHLSLVRMRAAENRRWILRSTNDGTTASIDPAGRVIETFQPFRETSGRLQYSNISEVTFYSKYGDLFAWTCAVLAAILLVLTQLPNFSARGA